MFQATPAKGLVFGFDVVRREDQHLQPRPAFVQHAVQPFSRSAIGPALCGARSSILTQQRRMRIAGRPNKTHGADFVGIWMARGPGENGMHI
jgi:hypothetical protein